MDDKQFVNSYVLLIDRNVGREMTLLHEFISNQKRLLELELRAEEDASVDPTKITNNNKKTKTIPVGMVDLFYVILISWTHQLVYTNFPVKCINVQPYA